MTPSQFKDTAIEATGQPKVMVPVSLVLVALSYVLGMNNPSTTQSKATAIAPALVGGLTDSERLLVLQNNLQHLTTAMSGLPNKLQSVETLVTSHTGRLDAHDRDIERIDGAISRIAWPGEMGAKP